MFSLTTTQDSPSGESQKQRELPGFAAFSAETGLTELPSGAGDLTAKELKFVCALLRHGQQKQAAIEAGYSADSADQIASELLRKPRVQGFYRRALEKLGSDTVATIRRIEERARVYHAKAMEAAQAIADLNALIKTGEREEHGKNYKHVEEYEVARERQVKLEAHYTRLATEQDKLLLSAAGKLNLNVNVSGDVNHHHEHSEVPASVLPFLSRVREAGVRSAN